MTDRPPIPSTDDGTLPVEAPVQPDTTPSVATLLRQLADDGRTLVRQEITLARLELQSNAVSFAKRIGLVGFGIGMLLVGLLVLTAFLVLALGVLLDGRYWLSSLIVGATLAVAGLVALLVGRSGLARQTMKPEQTVETIRDNREWMKAEARQLKSDLTSDGSQ